MPEELPNVNTPQVQSKPFPGKLIGFGVGLLILVIIGFFAWSLLNQKPSSVNKIVTGLSRDEIKLGWTSLSGVYPNNSNPPITDDSSINDSVFDSLVKFSGSSVVQSIATSWTNPNQNTWRFKIRTDVKFSSGDALTAQDVKFSFDSASASAANPDTAWSSSTEVADVKEVKVVDNQTVDVVTNKPDPIFLYKLVDVYILSKAQTSRDGIKKAVGSGPYKVASYQVDKEAVLVVNPSYWGPAPKVKKATFVVYQTDDDLLAALKKGEIDYAKVRTANPSVPNNFLIKKFDEPRVVMLFFNFAATKLGVNPNPLLNSKVREAIKLAIDPAQVIKEATVSGRPANQFVTKSIFGYDASLPTTSRNVSAAKSLLAQEKVAPFNFTILTTPDRQAVAQSVADQIKVSGITAKVKVVEDFGTLVGMLVKGDGQAFIAGPIANEAGEYVQAIFRTDGDQNILSYSNSSVDSLIDQASKSFNPTERKQLLAQITEKILAETPVVPLYSITDTYIMKDSFDFNVNGYAEFHLIDVSGREVQQESK